MLGAWTTSRSIDHLERGVKIGLNGQVGHDHQRHGAVVGGIVAGVVLDHAGDANPLVAQDLGQPGQHAGPVGDREVEVIAALDLARGSERDRGGRFGPEVQHSRRQGGPAGDDVDQVADDRRGGRHRAGTSAVEKGVAHGVADHADRVVRAADLGQRRPVLDQGRRNAQLQPVF